MNWYGDKLMKWNDNKVMECNDDNNANNFEPLESTLISWHKNLHTSNVFAAF